MTDIITVGNVALVVVPMLVLFKVLQHSADNPKPVYVDAPPPKVYAAIRRGLAGFHMGEQHFRIVVADPTTLTLRAVSEWRERVDKDLVFIHPQGYTFHQVILDVSVALDKETRKTRVSLRWSMHGILPSGRAGFVQDAATRVLEDVLASLQTQSNRAGQQIK